MFHALTRDLLLQNMARFSSAAITYSVFIVQNMSTRELFKTANPGPTGNGCSESVLMNVRKRLPAFSIGREMI